MREFEIREKQDKINQTDYWDGRILDLQISYFGDEVHLYIESYHENKVDLEECWKVSFLACAALNYETDAQNRKKFKVKDFTQNHLYTCQEISLEYYDDSFFQTRIVLEGLVMLNIISRDVTVAKIKRSEHDFFWRNKS